MFKFAEYLNRTMVAEVCGKVVHIKQPSINVNRKIEEIEKDITSENLIEKRLEVLRVLVSNNEEGIVFSSEDLQAYPVQVVGDFIQAMNRHFGNPENDPN